VPVGVVPSVVEGFEHQNWGRIHLDSTIGLGLCVDGERRSLWNVPHRGSVLHTASSSDDFRSVRFCSMVGIIEYVYR